MYTQNLFSNDKITIDDILKLKEQLITHYCFVHDEKLKKEIEGLNIPELDIKVNQYIEKGKIILIDKNKCGISIL